MSNFKIKAQEQNAKMGAQLKLIRTDKRFTMRALADRLGTPHSFIGKTEQLNRRLDVGEFTQYCLALEVDPVAVFSELVKRHAN